MGFLTTRLGLLVENNRLVKLYPVSCLPTGPGEPLSWGCKLCRREGSGVRNCFLRVASCVVGVSEKPLS